jgi:hypothetical protein
MKAFAIAEMMASVVLAAAFLSLQASRPGKAPPGRLSGREPRRHAIAFREK